MNFSRRRQAEDEALGSTHIVPLIDVLLVMLIFLAASTTFTRTTQLRIHLPTAQTQSTSPVSVEVAVSQNGLYALNGTLIEGTTPFEIALALRQATAGMKDPLLVINADAQATHQSVVNIMEAAQQAGIERITFAAQTSP